MSRIPTPVVLVTGLSGAGKASILRALEDIGYEAVDNPPLSVVETMVDRGSRPLAIGLDARTSGFDAPSVIDLRQRLRDTPGVIATMVFAAADPTTLLRRFTETRRRHPLAPQGRVLDGIEAEIGVTAQLRAEADLVIDTSDLPLPALRQRIEQRFGLGTAAAPGMALVLMSFAFPAGLPREADMVFDARFLRNPHYDPALRPGTGLDAPVAAYIDADPDYDRFFRLVGDMLRLVLPRFIQEGKKYATVAVGCTGGRHRSVRIVDGLARLLQSELPATTLRITTLHRELTKPPLPAISPVAAPAAAP